MAADGAYRAYVLDESGKIIGFHPLEDCPSDDEALRRARQMLDGHDLEVWNGGRKLGRVSRAEKPTNQ